MDIVTEPAVTVRPVNICAEAVWDFRTGNPSFHHPGYGAFGTFDPFPAYPHDLGEVQAAADHVARCCPPLWPVEIHVADREETGRSNGFSNLHVPSRYDGDQWVRGEPIALVMLSGKRVPPHPAMSHYLTAHEYGHHVEWMLNHTRGSRARHLQDEGLVREYAAARGLPLDTLHHGSGGRWHNSATEIFACDFRILVCQVETGYWPHPGIAHPDDTPMAAWWDQALADLAAHRGQPASKET